MRHRVWESSIVVSLLGLLIAPTAFAQDRARAGLGVSISDFSESVRLGSSTSTPLSITPTIFVPINISSRFRVEPEVGFGWGETVNAANRTQSNSVLHVGSGVFAVTPKDRFAVYYGARVAYVRYTQSSVGTSGSNSFTYPTATGFFVAPAVGGEYFLSDRLSLGGEVQVRYTSSTFHAGSGSGSITAKSADTHGAFTLRFWFSNQ
jgi:hypothetical protein